MSIVIPFSLLCAAVLAFPATTASADQGGSAGLIEINAGLLSVRLEKVALSDVLRTVGEQAGALVSIHGDLGNVQPQVFWSVPLSDGIKRLVQNSNADLVVIYSRDNAGHIYLAEIRAYEGNRNHLTSLPANPGICIPAPPPLAVPAGS
jgi:hypothetical protein